MRKGQSPTWAILALPMIGLLSIPVLALLVRGLPYGLGAWNDAEIGSSVLVSLRSSLCSVLLIFAFGTPLSLLIAKSKAGAFLSVLVEVPIVLPPAAAGIGLLLALGRNGLIPTQLPFSFGAVIIAQTFVSAPYFIRGVAAAIADLEPHLEEAASLDGASDLVKTVRITFPVIRSSVISGLALSWARAMGEFGATIIFAGALLGSTQTISTSIYLGLEGGLKEPVALSILLLSIAFVVLAVVKLSDKILRSNLKPSG